MHIPTKKLKNGFEMPVFGMGTYRMGEENRDQDDINTIKAALVSALDRPLFKIKGL